MDEGEQRNFSILVTHRHPFPTNMTEDIVSTQPLHAVTRARLITDYRFCLEVSQRRRVLTLAYPAHPELGRNGG